MNKLFLINNGEDQARIKVCEICDNYHNGKYSFTRKRVADSMLITLPKLFIDSWSIHVVGEQRSIGKSTGAYIEHCRSHKISYDPINQIILLTAKASAATPA